MRRFLRLLGRIAPLCALIFLFTLIGLGVALAIAPEDAANDTSTPLGLIVAMLRSAGLASVVEYFVAAVTIASALDAIIPQPAEGSHWLPVRKALSFVAVNLGHAKPGSQPPLMTWLSRVLQPLVDAQLARQQPPAPPPAAPAAPVVAKPPAAPPAAPVAPPEAT